MLSIVAAVVLALHGLVHLIGFVVPWRLAEIQGFPYKTTALNGAIALGDAGARAVGLVWLALAVVFVVAAVAVWRDEPWALPLTGVVASASLVACVFALPEAVAGVALNVVILAVVAYLAFLARAVVTA